MITLIVNFGTCESVLQTFKMLKAVVTEGRRSLLKTQFLKSLYGSCGSGAVYSTSPKNGQNPTEEEVARAIVVPTMYKPKKPPTKSFSELVAMMEALKELDNTSAKQMSTKLTKKVKRSIQTGSQSELGTLFPTSLVSESQTASETRVDLESNTATQTGLVSESQTASETSVDLESNTATPSSEDLELRTETSEGLESQTGTATSVDIESNTATETSLGLASQTATQSGLYSESEELLKVELMPDQCGNELEPIQNTTDTDLDIQERLPKTIYPKVHSLAALVNENRCLQKLVALHVDLSVVQKQTGTAQYLVASDYEKHIHPYVLFLTALNVENIGEYLTKYIGIVRIDIAQLRNILKYLNLKGFHPKDISRIVSNSKILLMDVQSIDQALGHLQLMFSLKGKEVRAVLIKTPKLLNKPNILQLIEENKLHSKEILGFSNMELKTILLTYPGFFMKRTNHLSMLFDYFHHTMEINHKTLVQNIHIFKSRLSTVQNRHSYLLKLNRAQYDPEKENFVSFTSLVSGTNEEFCTKVAKTTLEDYYKFLNSF